MIALFLWMLVVFFFYFRQVDSLFEYVAFLARHAGRFSLWHPYALKALGGLAMAVWIAWAASRCGGRILRKLAPALEMSTGERTVFSAGLGFGAVALLTFALGALHLWYVPVFWASLLLATAAYSPSWKGGVAAPSRECRDATLAAQTGWPRSRMFDYIQRGLLLFAGVIFLVGDLSPEVFYDSLHYHLAVPNLYLINHRIVDPPNLAYSAFVMAGQMMWGFAITVGNEITAKVLHGAAALLLVLTLLAFEERYFSRGAGLLGALIFLSTPLVGMNITTAGIDVVWTALQLLGVFALTRAITESHEAPTERQWLRLSGILTGLAASCKYTGLPAIPIACTIILLKKRRLAPFLIPAALMVAPFLVKNIVFHHNPIYPFAATVLGEPRLTAQDWQNIAKETQPRNLPGDLSSIAFHPWLITMKGRSGMDFVGPLLLALLPLVIFARPSGAAYSLLARYSLGLWVVWFLSTSVPRFAMPLLAIVSLLFAHALLRSNNASVFGRAVLALCLIGVVTNLYFTFFFNSNSENWRVLAGQMSERDYLADHHPTYPAPGYEAFQWMNQNLPAGSKILIAGDSRSYPIRVSVLPSSTFNTQAIVEAARQARNGDDLARLLQQQGVTHLFINFAEAVRTESYGLFAFDARTWSVIEDFWSRHLETIWVRYNPDPGNLKGLFIYRLVPNSAAPPPPNPLERWKPK